MSTIGSSTTTRPMIWLSSLVAFEDGAAKATWLAERLCTAVGDERPADSRVLIARCGPSGEAGPLRRERAAFALADADVVPSAIRCSSPLN